MISVLPSSSSKMSHSATQWRPLYPVSESTAPASDIPYYCPRHPLSPYSRPLPPLPDEKDDDVEQRPQPVEQESPMTPNQMHVTLEPPTPEGATPKSTSSSKKGKRTSIIIFLGDNHRSSSVPKLEDAAPQPQPMPSTPTGSSTYSIYQPVIGTYQAPQAIPVYSSTNTYYYSPQPSFSYYQPPSYYTLQVLPPTTYIPTSPSLNQFGVTQQIPGDPLDLTGHVFKTRAQAHAYAGFSDVFRGQLDDYLQTQVAMKVLRAVRMSGSDEEKVARIRKRLKREVNIWRNLSHARITQLLGYAFVDGSPCLLSRWCSNGNVMEYLNRSPSSNRFDLVLQAAEGLYYLHTRAPAVVHGDLKGQNVLIDDNGRAMLCDFGLSKLDIQESTGYTTSNNGIRTLRWSAKEIIEGAPSTLQSDVYSFASLALEILTLRLPFHYLKTDSAVLQAIARDQTPSPEHYPELPPTDPYWDLFAACWSGVPTWRPLMGTVINRL